MEKARHALKNALPMRLVFAGKQLLSFPKYHGSAIVCPVCGNSFGKLKSYGWESGLYDNKRIVGAGRRENVMCPVCSASERMRQEYLYLRDVLHVFDRPCRLLHFAPEDSLYSKFSRAKNITYDTCDIRKGYAMHVVDITAISFADATFDYVICNHVLEHVQDEHKALSELKRVLKPGGKALLTVPICIDNETTFEDASIQSTEDRIKHYGHAEHVRLYGRDFRARLESASFATDIFVPQTDLSAADVKRYALIPDETVFIAAKA